MQMPLNIGDVFNIATDMQEVKSTSISVSLIIDSSANAKLSAHVRAAFASEASKTRVRINYLDDPGVFDIHRGDDDIVVLVAGTSSQIGEFAEKCRDEGIPVMVVTDDAQAVSENAKTAGFSIPPADIITPVEIESVFEAKLFVKLPFLKNIIKGSNKPSSDMSNMQQSKEGGASSESVGSKDASQGEDVSLLDKLKRSNHPVEVVVGNDADTGEISLDDEVLRVLDERMGKWIISVCKDKDLAFAYSFPFIRRPLATESIQFTSMENGAIGLIPILPGADMPIMTLNQVKMALQIATAYGQPVDKERIKEIVAVVGGALFCRQAARSLAKFVPGLGWLISGTIGFIATWTMGYALLEYFEAGGDIVGAASVLQTARNKALDISREVLASNTGKAVVGKIRSVTDRKSAQ